MFFDLFAFTCPCALCGRPHRHPVCPDCQREMERYHQYDGPTCRCALPTSDASSGALCGRCVTHPPPFTAVYCPWIYQFPFDQLINGYKHRGRLDQERALQSLIANTALPWPEAELLCPLPAHWHRTLARGFDQADRLASALAPQWRRPIHRLLRRRHATVHQQGHSRAHRLHNLRGAFQAAAQSRGRRILLIDDVMTTGASARAAATCLLESGAREVRIWILARTLDPQGG